MAPSRTDRLQGNLDLLILRALAREPMHGWAIAQRLESISRSVLQVGQGSIYPALRRLEDEGWIDAEWGVSEAGRRARFYRLTTSGRRQLERERAQWEEFVAAVGRVLQQA
jgi:PadR family transcriptional regulator, regulatory protein PadR